MFYKYTCICTLLWVKTENTIKKFDNERKQEKRRIINKMKGTRKFKKMNEEEEEEEDE
jgi:hypothetical protein